MQKLRIEEIAQKFVQVLFDEGFRVNIDTLGEAIKFVKKITYSGSGGAVKNLFKAQWEANTRAKKHLKTLEH